MEELTLKKFEEAAEKVKEATLPTNLIFSEYFSNQTGNKVYLKPENMQYTGAYKVRGAYYKISTMSEEARKKGLITASAGNHAQGVAFAAKKYGVKATVELRITIEAFGHEHKDQIVSELEKNGLRPRLVKVNI